MDKKYVTIKKAAEILGVSPLTLRNWDKSGKFKAVRHPMNNYRVYKIEDINKLTDDIESNTAKAPGIKKLQIRHLDN